MSPLIYTIYNADLVDLPAKPKSIMSSGFMDDLTYLVAAKSFKEVVDKLSKLVASKGGILNWARKHNATFEFTKCVVVGFSQNKEKFPCPPVEMNGITINTTDTYKYLGAILDKEQCFNNQTANKIAKEAAWTSTIRRICNTKTGIPPVMVLRLYQSVVVPRVL